MVCKFQSQRCLMEWVKLKMSNDKIIPLGVKIVSILCFLLGIFLLFSYSFYDLDYEIQYLILPTILFLCGVLSITLAFKLRKGINWARMIVLTFAWIYGLITLASLLLLIPSLIWDYTAYFGNLFIDLTLFLIQAMTIYFLQFNRNILAFFIARYKKV